MPGPAQRQSSLFRLTLERGVHGSVARSRLNTAKRNLRVSLESQINDHQPTTAEDCVALLPDVAEGTNEVIPVQHRSRVIRGCAHGRLLVRANAGRDVLRCSVRGLRRCRTRTSRARNLISINCVGSAKRGVTRIVLDTAGKVDPYASFRTGPAAANAFSMSVT